MKWSESHSVVSNSLWPHGLYSSWNSPGQNTGVGSLSLLQRIFPTGTEPRSLALQVESLLSEPPRKPKNIGVDYPFSRGSSQSRNRTGISCIAGRFFTNWAIREALGLYDPKFNDKCPYKRHIARRSHRWRKTKSDAAGSHGMPGDMRSRKSKRGFSLRVFRGKEIL